MIQTAALTPDQIAALSTDAVSNLTPTQIAGLSLAQFRRPDRRGPDGAPWTPTEVAAITGGGTELGALTGPQLAGLGRVQLRALTSAQFALLKPAQIAALSPTQVSNLTVAQIAGLTPQQFAALSPGAGQRGSTVTQVQKPEHRRSLVLERQSDQRPQHVADFGDDHAGDDHAVGGLQIDAMVPLQVGALHARRRSPAMTPDQLAAMQPRWRKAAPIVNPGLGPLEESGEHAFAEDLSGHGGFHRGFGERRRLADRGITGMAVLTA